VASVREAGEHARRVARTLAGVALLGLGLCALPAAAAPCDPWPGEPDPLPKPDDPNPLRAQWAELRIRELALVAERFEDADPERAQQLWRRLLCMDPANDAALAGVLRARAVLVHRPPLLGAPGGAPVTGDAWAALAAPIEVRPPQRPAPRESAQSAPAPRDAFAPLRSALATLAQQVRTAEFDSALESSGALRQRLAQLSPSPTRNGLVVQTEVLAATAQLALGRDADAAGSLRRALAANPALELDPRTTSPKVVRALERAREGAR
jgi:hypothetical protein